MEYVYTNIRAIVGDIYSIHGAYGMFDYTYELMVEIGTQYGIQKLIVELSNKPCDWLAAEGKTLPKTLIYE